MRFVVFVSPENMETLNSTISHETKSDFYRIPLAISLQLEQSNQIKLEDLATRESWFYKTLTLIEELENELCRQKSAEAVYQALDTISIHRRFFNESLDPNWDLAKRLESQNKFIERNYQAIANICIANQTKAPHLNFSESKSWVAIYGNFLPTVAFKIRSDQLTGVPIHIQYYHKPDVLFKAARTGMIKQIYRISDINEYTSKESFLNEVKIGDGCIF